MAATVTRNRHGILGAAGGIPNDIIYLGKEIDLTAVDSPITAENTLCVKTYNESTGAREYYRPGLNGDFTTMHRGSLAGGVSTGRGFGRGYTIVALQNFTMDNVAPA